MKTQKPQKQNSFIKLLDLIYTSVFIGCAIYITFQVLRVFGIINIQP